MKPHSTLILKDVKIPVDMVHDLHAFGGVQIADCLQGDLLIEDGRVRSFLGDQEISAPITEGQGKILMPKLVEVHSHLDKCHIIERMGAVGGDLAAAIEAIRTDKENWTPEDVRIRAEQGLNEYIAAGCRAVRSHVDWGENGSPPMSWLVMTELREDYHDQIDLQLVALTGIDQFSDPDFGKIVGQALHISDGVLGCFMLNHADMERDIKAVFQTAMEYDLDLDFHVDEGLDQDLRGIELIADTALEMRYQGRIVCGHVCSLMNKFGDELDVLLAKIKSANISIVSLPTTNLYLQGRAFGTPDRRGLTRIHELRNAGITVALGTDNVGDSFCPLGKHDPLHTVSLGVLAAHLDPPFSQWLKAITIDASAAIGLPPVYVDGAKLSDLLMTHSTYTAQLLSGGVAAPICLDQYLAEQTVV